MQTDFNSIILEQAHEYILSLKKADRKDVINKAIAVTILEIMQEPKIQELTINERYTMIDIIYKNWHKHLEYVLLFSEILLNHKNN